VTRTSVPLRPTSVPTGPEELAALRTAVDLLHVIASGGDEARSWPAAVRVEAQGVVSVLEDVLIEAAAS
jgi:hypothetical protein